MDLHYAGVSTGIGIEATAKLQLALDLVSKILKLMIMEGLIKLVTF